MSHRKDLVPELVAIQQRLDGPRGKRYWRTLEELADSDAFRELMEREFPAQAAVWPDSISRRRFLGLMGASLALNGQPSVGMVMVRQRLRKGAGLRVLSETVVSPTLARQADELLKAFPAARWHQYEPVNRDTAYRGARLAFGTPVNTVYQFD